jgi:ubiquitin-protein ligase
MLDEYITDINMFNVDNELILLKYNNNESYITIHLEVHSYPVKIITDFDKYCFAESVIQNIGLDNFNLSMCFKDKNVTSIIKELYNNIMIEKPQEKESNDPFHIYQKIDKYDKTNIDYVCLNNDFLNKLDITIKKRNDFLLSQPQTIQLIINEIKKVNSNREYKHYITIDPLNMFSLIVCLDLDDPIEIRLNIDPYFYPSVPPKIEYIKPKIKLELLFSIINLDILLLRNWCPTITLEYLITNLADQLKPIIKNYIIKDKVTIENELDYEIIHLASLIKDNMDNKIKINIPIPKKQLKMNNSSSYWKSGTGYGSTTDINNGWDLSKYIEEQEFEKNKITEKLYNINKLIKSSTNYSINDSLLESYIINHTRDLTILELEKNKQLYRAIFEILYTLINKTISESLINIIYNNIKIISEEVHDIVMSNKELYKVHQLFLLIMDTFRLFSAKYKETNNVQNTELIISSNIKEKYCQVMKILQFGNYEIPTYHYYGKNNTKMNQSAIIRTLSEISSFKNGLPLNWESSIWVRVSKTNFNIFSFLISGPKDTPYENGLFEFHAYFPIDYPNTVPEVVIHTTDNGKIRFNPNLYANGKVCLSLLGTWSGQENEKWNPKTSSFLQVMVSIQSLILVEDPFFNEPGYERDMHTPKGKACSAKYNQDLQPNTIRLGMINMIKNPPPGFEEVVKNHFSMKKEEILNTTLLWEQNATTHKEIIKTLRQELIDIILF